MIEKIKYHLRKALASKQMRVSCLAVMTAVTVAVVTLLSYSIYTVNIFDGESTYTVRTLNNNVTSILSGLNLKSENYSIKNTKISGRTTSIEIAYSFPVYVTHNSTTAQVEVTGGTVGDVLASLGYKVDEYDFVEPSADTVINDTVYIDYTDIGYFEGSYTEEIPYETVRVYSDQIEKGKSTLKAGTAGVKLVKFTEKTVNGISVERNITETSVVSEAVNATETVGTKVVASNTAPAVSTSSNVNCISVLTPDAPIQLDANGNPVNFKSKMTVRATAYTYTGNRCATGVSPAPGYIAVNPKVIPYGTKLYIKSPDGRIVYGYAVAADTGGFIKKHPTGIDLFMSSKSACTSFGVRNMEVYILE